MPRIARGGVGGAAHRRSGPSAFELAFLNTWLLFPCPISDLARRLGLTFVISGDFGETKLNLTQIPLPPCIPYSFPPPIIFSPFWPPSLASFPEGSRPPAPLCHLFLGTRWLDFLNSSPFAPFSASFPLCHLLVSWGGAEGCYWKSWFLNFVTANRKWTKSGLAWTVFKGYGQENSLNQSFCCRVKTS